jgi:hypothetical protein
MKAVLVRIGVDHSYGAWNAPLDPRTLRFLFVPIPDNDQKEYSPGNCRSYNEIAAPLAEFEERSGVGRLPCPPALQQCNMHLDPDFDHLTYGDNGTRRGARIARLGPNDLVVFYAGLRSIITPRHLVYALVGLFVVEEVVRAVCVPPDRRHENAHTRWKAISDDDIVVRGKRGESGRLDHGIPIGEWRDRAYRVRRDIEAAWGGLTVRNGYIQRSAVPPEFLDGARFYDWFRRQDVKLLERNN